MHVVKLKREEAVHWVVLTGSHHCWCWRMLSLMLSCENFVKLWNCNMRETVYNKVMYSEQWVRSLIETDIITFWILERTSIKSTERRYEYIWDYNKTHVASEFGTNLLKCVYLIWRTKALFSWAIISTSLKRKIQKAHNSSPLPKFQS